MTAGTTTNHESQTANTFVRLLQSEYLVLFLSLLYFVVFLPFTPGFASPGNFANLLATLLPLFLVAMGQTIVLITGGIDLSVSSIIALCSITGAAILNGDHGWLAGHPLAVPAALLAMLLVGAIVGLLNGLAVTRFKMPPFIVTLAAMMFFSGLALWLTKSKNIGHLPAAFNAIGGKTWLALIVTIVLALAAHVMLNRSLWGRWLYASGHNAHAAFISGVPVVGVIVSAYVISGVFAAAASVLYTGQAESGSPVLAQRLLLDIVGATVIGGTSLFGGRGKILWTLFGVLFLKLMDNSLNLLDLSFFTIMMVKGAVILLAALMDSVRVKLAAVR
jgi:ribose/xylose/arabinose/galactoside ABC-type transport system permease subunit